jgi:phytoene/squalene synthetase
MSALGASPADLAAVETVVKRAGTSFYRGMKILPKDRRAAMYAIYGFCRIVDDVADEPAPVPQKMAGLAAWRDRIAALYDGLEIFLTQPVALQLTNILRDVAEDAGRGRLYLPREWLDEAGVPPEPQAALHHNALPALCARMAAQAHRHFDQASAAMLRCDKRAMKPARLMGATYAALLDALQHRGWSHPEQPVKVSRWQKLWIALRHL